MKSIRLKSAEKHVPLEDDAGTGDRGQSDIDNSNEGGEETVDSPNESTHAPSNRIGKNLVLKIFLAGLAMAALAVGVYAALGRKEIDPPGLVSSSAVFGDSSLRIGDFNDGVKAGQQIAEDVWVANGSDCGYIFSYEDDVMD